MPAISGARWGRHCGGSDDSFGGSALPHRPGNSDKGMLICAYGIDAAFGLVGCLRRSGKILIPCPHRQLVGRAAQCSNHLHRWKVRPFYPIFERHQHRDSKEKGQPLSCPFSLANEATSGHRVRLLAASFHRRPPTQHLLHIINHRFAHRR